MLKLLAVTLAAAALVPTAAGAAPAVDGTFDLSGRPNHLALGPDGNVWIALESLTADFARVTPAGVVTEFDSPQVLNPRGIGAGPDGQLWVTQLGGVAHFSPADPRAARAVNIVALNSPQAIVTGPDGNLWTAANDQAIQIRTDETFRQFRVDGMGARGITSGPDGRLYIADFGGNRVAALTTDGSATFVPVSAAPQEVASGGGLVAATIPSNALARFTPPSATALESDVSLTDPTGIAFGEDGAFWAANFARDTLTRLTPTGDVTTLTGFPAASGPRHLTAGSGGTLWVGLETARQVARVTGVVAAPPAGGGSGGGGGGAGGGGDTPSVDVTKPVLSLLSVPRTLRVGRSGTLRVTLSEAATLSVRFERKLPGRRKAGRCVKPRRAPQGRHCARFADRGVQGRAARAGANELSVGGRIGRRVLPAGAYRVTIVAHDAAGKRSAAVRRSLTIIAPRRR